MNLFVASNSLPRDCGKFAASGTQTYYLVPERTGLWYCPLVLLGLLLMGDPVKTSNVK